MIRGRQRQRALPPIGLALLLAGCKPPEQPAVTSIVGAVLIDGTGGLPISDCVVTIESGRIRATRGNLLLRNAIPNVWRMAVCLGSGNDPYREMDLLVLVEAGISPADVLVAATRNGASALHEIEQTGTIEPGKRADLLLLSANPAEDIRNLRKSDRVMRDGQWIERPR